ncbi:MAG TPA: PQQ-dependent sugar dehydrogenase, partial [Planctomycetaceae bacterium]|nr:PQQ-dependent sugar dehydrogenase [Planctomycetaceae bacterium]
MRAFLWQWASRIVLGCALIGLCRTARAADAPDEVECRWANGPIEIDGKADEDAWKHAAVVEQFTLPWLQDKARPAKTATRARLLWDREYFYFFADMDDTDLYADVREHDGQTWDNDVFEIFLKPADDKPGYYEFQVNAAGATLDAFFPRRGAGGFGRFKNDADFHLEAKVKLRGTLNKWTDKDEGWSVEGRIPWRDFMKTGGRPKVGETWKYELCRYDYSVDFEGPELSNTNRKSSLNHPNFHQWEDYSTLKFVGPDPKQSARPVGIEKLAPMTTSRVVGSPDPPLPFRAKRVFPKLELAYSIAVATEPGSQRLLLITQPFSYGPTTLSRIDDTQEADDPEKLLTIDGVAYGMAFHPDFAKNGYIYVGSNGPLKGDKKTQVTRYVIAREKPWKLDPESARVIIEWASDGHNGGDLGFGRDGMLYITSGDGTSDSDTNIVGQDLTRLTAKVLRIDVDHPSEGREYSVPADNPFVGQADVRPETWAYGFRNPWRLTVDPHNGQIWVGNNGQDLWEQVYLIERGANYGWSVMEGSHPFYPNRKAGPTPFSKPAAEHPHSIARSLTGGVVYYGSRFPELKGAYLYGDYSTGKIWGLRHDGKQATWHQELADTTLAISGFGLDSQGELLIADHRAEPKGALYTFERTPESNSHEKFPRKLSETGLFASVAGHKPAAGTISYSVNAPLWSDGAIKERFLAIPSKDRTEPPIEMTANRGWNFPDETVLVKSFALNLVEGNSASRRWIETRLLTKQEGEWVGYSYMWNADQTDAELVAAEGLDRPYAVSDGKQARTQEWHFPSRTECMVCH